MLMRLVLLSGESLNVVRLLSLRIVLTEILVKVIGNNIWSICVLKAEELWIYQSESEIVDTDRPVRVTFVILDSLLFKCLWFISRIFKCHLCVLRHVNPLKEFAFLSVILRIPQFRETVH
jgi:hypothetical protein